MIKFIIILLGLIPLVWSTQVNANFFTAKSFLLYLVSGICFLHLAFQKNRDWQIPSRRWKWLALFFILLQLGYDPLINFPIGFYFLPKFLALLGIFLFFEFVPFGLDSFLRGYDGWLLGFFGVLFILTGRGFIDQNLIYPFGNVNMLAEFYLLCLPLVYFWIQQKSDFSKWIKAIVFVLINFIIVWTHSRSAVLGLSLWWGYLLICYVKDHFKTYLKRIIALIAIVLIGGSLAIHQKVIHFFASKEGSTIERANFYHSAFDLIKDHPLGVGSQYATQIVPYRLQYPAGPLESEYPDQPHSEILKWGVEFGWLGWLASILGLGLIIWEIVWSGSFLLTGALLVILPQLFFQFPFENPATIVLMAIYLYLFSKTLPQEKLLNNRAIKVILAFFGLGLIYFSSIYIFSIYQESNSPKDLTRMTQACELNPSYLRGCIRKNQNLLLARRIFDLKTSLKEDMRFNFYTADYLKDLSESFSDSNFDPDMVLEDDSQTSVSVYDSIQHRSRSLENNCQIIHVYAFIYKQQQHFIEDDLKACQNIPDPFDLNLPPFKFNQEYKAWLDSILL